MADTISAVSTPAGSAQPEPASVVVERGRDGKKVYRIQQEFVIEGRIQKPTVFVTYGRQSMGYEWNQLQEGFLYKIAEPLNDKPF